MTPRKKKLPLNPYDFSAPQLHPGTRAICLTAVALTRLRPQQRSHDPDIQDFLEACWHAWMHAVRLHGIGVELHDEGGCKPLRLILRGQDRVVLERSLGPQESPTAGSPGPEWAEGLIRELLPRLAQEIRGAGLRICPGFSLDIVAPT